MPRRKQLEDPWWHGRFRGCGFRMTMGRDAILAVLTQSDEHLSAEDIYLQVHQTCPSVGLTTVYRTLEVLVGMGLVHKLDFGDGRARYELAAGPDKEGHHHHLVCTQCRRVINYTDFIDEEVDLLTKTQQGLAKKYHFHITDHVIQFYGRCESCDQEGR